MFREEAVVALLAISILAACQSYSPPHEEPGVSSGGAALGVFIASHIGRRMEGDDRVRAAQVLEIASDGHASKWRNPETGDRYSLTPTRTYDSASGRCRDFITTAVVDRKEHEIRGTACKQPGGVWRAL